MWGPDGRRWHFDSGSLALDFGYTGDYGFGRPDWERLHSPADLDTWLASRFGTSRGPVDERGMEAALRLRGAITALASSAADRAPLGAGSIDELNAFAAMPPIPPHLRGGTQPAQAATLSAMLSTIATDAISILSASGERVRRCGADDCALIFYDHSRPNGRRWCSMARCGNRAKVRTYRASIEG